MSDEDMLDRRAALDRKRRFIEEDREAWKEDMLEASFEKTAQAVKSAAEIYVEERRILLTRGMVRKLLSRQEHGSIRIAQPVKAIKWLTVTRGLLGRGGSEVPVCTPAALIAACNRGAFGTDPMGRFSLMEVASGEDLRGRNGQVLGYKPPEFVRGRPDIFAVDEVRANIIQFFRHAERDIRRRQRISDSLNPDHRIVRQFAWVCQDGDPKKPPVDCVEDAVPFEVFYDHYRNGQILAVRSLKPEGADNAELTAVDAEPFTVECDGAGGLTLRSRPGAEETGLRIEDAGPFVLTVRPKARTVEIEALDIADGSEERRDEQDEGDGQDD